MKALSEKSPYSLNRLYWFVPFCTIITTVFCFGRILFITMMKPFCFDLIPMIRILNPFYFSLILFCSKLCFDFIPMIRITKEFCFGLMPLIRMINPFYFGLSLFWSKCCFDLIPLIRMIKQFCFGLILFYHNDEFFWLDSYRVTYDQYVETFLFWLDSFFYQNYPYDLNDPYDHNDEAILFSFLPCQSLWVRRHLLTKV